MKPLVKPLGSLLAALLVAGLPPAWGGEAATSSSDASRDAQPDQVEQVVWRGVPIRVDLRLGTERIVALPGVAHVRAGLLGGPVPGLRIQVLGNRAYLLAKQPFAATRLLLQADSGQSVLLDLAAAKQFPAGPTVSILTPRTTAPLAQDAPPVAPETTPTPPSVGYVALVRHAAQSLYAPARLIPRTRAIVRAPLRVRDPIPLVRGGAVEATPVASWRAAGRQGPLWVTACRLQNQTDEPVVLDPRNLRGSWLAASFQHARLAPKGDTADTTTVYVISSRRFDRVIAPWLKPPAPLALAGANQQAPTKGGAAQ